MHVLVSGASMAGLSAAYWFRRMGADVDVVERAPALRQGGAPIDVRGEALEVSSEMGILDSIREQQVVPAGPSDVLGADGTVVATMDLTWFANERDDDVEISRDRLNDIIRGVLDPAISFRFSSSIATMSEDADGVDVTFVDGDAGRYDLVVGADGLHSTVRQLAFGAESEFVHHQGVYVALVTLDPAEQWRSRTGFSSPGRMIAIREEGDGPYAMIMFRSPRIEHDYRDAEAQRAIVAEVLDGVDVWEVARIREAFLAGRPDDGFYLDSLSQTHMDRWGRRRVALIGDAAHCSSLLSGMGTSLAMMAAKFLAEEVHRTPDDLEAAYDRFDGRLRPFVDKAQASIGDNGEMMVPSTAEGVEARNAALRELAAAHATS